MENFNHFSYRKNLADKLRQEEDKKKRSDIFEEEKKSNEYLFAQKRHNEDVASKLESRESGEYLQVEQGRLMHSGAFDKFFSGKLDPKDIDELHFGVCCDNKAENNPSIREYVHSKRFSGFGGVFTAVYKKDYADRVLLYGGGKNRRGELNENRDYKKLELLTEEEKEEIKNMDYLHDEGLPTSGEQIFNPDEIEAIICYSERNANRLQKACKSFSDDVSHISFLVEKVSGEALLIVKDKLQSILKEHVKNTIEDELKSGEEIMKAAENVRELINMAYKYLDESEPIPEVVEKWAERNFSNEELVARSIDWIIDKLSRFGYNEAIDILSRDWRENESMLREIISKRAELPMSKKILEASQKINLAQDELPNLEIKYLKLIEEADNISIDEVIKQIGSDPIIGGLEMPEFAAKMLHQDEYKIKNEYPGITLYAYKKIW